MIAKACERCKKTFYVSAFFHSSRPEKRFCSIYCRNRANSKYKRGHKLWRKGAKLTTSAPSA